MNGMDSIVHLPNEEGVVDHEHLNCARQFLA